MEEETEMAEVPLKPLLHVTVALLPVPLMLPPVLMLQLYDVASVAEVV